MRTLAVIAVALLSSASAYAQSSQIQLPPVGLPAAPEVAAPPQHGGLPGPGPSQQNSFPGGGPSQQGAYGQQPGQGIMPVAVVTPQPLLPPAGAPQGLGNPGPAQNAVLPGPSPQPAPVQPGVGEAPANPLQQRIETLRTRVEEKLGQLDNAAPALTGSQLQQMQRRQLRIRETLMMGQEAKALAEVMKQLDEMGGGGGGEGGKAGPAPSEEETKRKIDEAVQQALAQKKIEEDNAPKPLVASVHGSGGSLRAVVLVPYVGQFTVRSGSGLPGGMKVVSVSDAGVVVVKDGKRFPLAFGTEVPRVQPASAMGLPGGQPGGRTVQMPIGSSPLPMGGLGSR